MVDSVLVVKKRAERAAQREHFEKSSVVHEKLEKLGYDIISHSDLWTAIAESEFAFGLWIRERVTLGMLNMIQSDDKRIKEMNGRMKKEREVRQDE